MAKIKIIEGDANDISIHCDLIFTDPPFDMPGNELGHILDKNNVDHLVLITTMKQLIELLQCSDWQLSFDFVIDSVVPKKSMNIHQPNYTHATGAYLIRNGARSIFNRKRRQRSDTFDNNGYWPSIIRAPRERLSDHGMAKNEQAITDIVGSFEVKHVYDPFAGSGTVGFACFELGIDCTLNEIDGDLVKNMREYFRFLL